MDNVKQLPRVETDGDGDEKDSSIMCESSVYVGISSTGCEEDDGSEEDDDDLRNEHMSRYSSLCQSNTHTLDVAAANKVSIGEVAANDANVEPPDLDENGVWEELESAAKTL